MPDDATRKPTMFVDTRQKEGRHAVKHEQMRARYELVRSKLYVGDYMLVGGRRSVDTKASVRELACNVWQEHDRFVAELDRARDAGIDLWVLVEDLHGIRNLNDLASWMEPPWETRAHGGTRLDGGKLARTCATTREHHGGHFVFVHPDRAGEAVMWILEGERRHEDV